MAAESSDNFTRVLPTNDSSSPNNPNENDAVDADLEAWNPMAEDYTNRAFNNYSEPTTAELKKWMPKQGEQGPNEDLMACYRSKDGDVRLFVNGIPPELSQEGLKGLFNQAGKVVYCKVISLRDPNRKDTFGFVGYQSYKEAEKAIRLFDGFSLGSSMRLKVSLAKKSRESDFPSDLEFKRGPPAENGNTKEEDWESQYTPMNPGGIVCSVANGNDGVTNENNIAVNGSAAVTGDNAVAMETRDNVTMNEPPIQNGHCAEMGLSQQQDDVPKIMDQSTNHDLAQATGFRVDDGACGDGSEARSNAQSVQNKPKIPEGPCSLCGKTGNRRCSSCKIHYCSKQCQRTDWPEHKKVCNWKKAEQKEPEVRVIKKDEPYVIDEDEIDIPDPISFISSFGANLHNNIEREVPAAAYKQDKYHDFDEEYIAVPQANRAQITEITDIANSPSIEEIPPVDSQQSETATNHLITEIKSSSSQFMDAVDPSSSSMITELSSGEALPAKSADPVKSEVKESSASEATASHELLEPKPQLPLITEITSEEVPSNSSEPQSHSGTPLDNAVPKPLITELSSEDFHSQQPTRTEMCETNVNAPPQCQSPSTENQNIKQEDMKEKMEVFKRYSCSDLPCESLSVNSWHDIVVTSVSSPNVFWVQLFQIEALQRQNTLYETLDGLYTDLPYKNYVPMAGDVCVAQYSKDGSWYRSKVNYINNNGYINVTHIDFGSSEDVDPSSIRRITSDLASIPVQGIKCSLYFPDSTQREYSPEMIQAFCGKVLDVKCSTEVKEKKHNNVYCLEVYDANGSKINDMFKAKVSTESTSDAQAPPVSSPNSSSGQQIQTSQESNQESNQSEDYNTSSGELVQPRSESASSVATLPGNTTFQSDDPALPERFTQPISTPPPTTAPQQTETDLAPIPKRLPEQQVQPVAQKLSENPHTLSVKAHQHLPHPSQSPQSSAALTSPSVTGQAEQGQVASNTISNPSCESLERYETLSKSSSDADQRNSKTPSPRKYPTKHRFEAVVNSVISPREFSVVQTDPKLLEKLEELSTKLQSHCLSSPYDPSVEYQFGEMCAIKSSKDKEWHRATITNNRQRDRYFVYLSDVDAKETVTPENMRPLPDSLKTVPQRCMQCSLAFIVRRAGTEVYGKLVIDRFTSLVLNKKFTCQEVKNIKSVLLVELLDESGQPSVARQLIDEGLVDEYSKKQYFVNPEATFEDGVNPTFFLPCKCAITSAKLPEHGQVFQATVTQFQSPTNFFIHLNDGHSKQKLEKLSQDMNNHYTGMPLPADWQAREQQLCAAFFKSSWLRAFVQKITEENVATIYCVDFGNLEIVSSSSLRPLVPEFSALPYCALHCSLANISPRDSTEWSKEAVDFVRVKMPLSSVVDVKLVYKGQTVIFLDVILPTCELVSDLMISKNFAVRRRHSPNKYHGSGNQTLNDYPKQGPYQQRYKDGRSPPHRKFNEGHGNTRPHYNDSLSASQHRSRETRSPPKKHRGRGDEIWTPKETAIYNARLPFRKESIKVFVTHITSPGCFAVQIADVDMVSKIASLQSDMNAHYSTATYPSYQPVINQVCAAQFMTDNSWYRAWIEKIVDNKVHVYYPDYGNSETLDVSRLRPLESCFLALPFVGLTCSLSSITTEGEWSEEATALFSKKIQLYHAMEVNLRFQKSDCIYVDIADPEDPSTSLSKVLVAKNLAVWMIDPKKTRQEPPCPVNNPLAMAIDIREKNPRLETLEQTVEIPVNRLFLDALPLVSIKHGDVIDAMVCDVTPQGAISFQVLTKDLEELATLGSEINSHCSGDQSAYTPIANELCFACFSEDKEWYRAVVSEVLPGDQFKVTFVDYGNQDTVSSQNIRVFTETFLGLPRQAYTGALKSIASSDQSPLPDDIIGTLKQQLLEKRSFVRVDGEGVEVFPVSSDGKQGPSLNEVVSQILYPKVGIPTEINDECVAMVTEVNGTGDIWIQRADLFDLNELSASINKYCEEGGAAPVTAQPSPGDILLARHSFYNKWYRVKVLESQPSSSRVLFVDHGYTEDVPLNNLRKPKPEFLRMSFQAAKCYLVRVAQGNPSADDFIKQILEREFKVKICEKKGDLLGVELDDFGVPNGPLNLNDYLIGFGYQA